MKKLILLVVVLLLAFYGGWPALSSYQLHSALERKDVATVERKIDFASVRRSLEPIVVQEVGTGMDRHLADLGPLAAMLGPLLKQHYAPKVVEATLSTLITPDNIVRIYAEKDDFRSAAERILIEEFSKPGGLFASLFGSGASTGGPASAADKPKLPGGLGGLSESVQRQLGAAGGGAPAVDLKAVLTQMIEKGRAQRGAKPMTEAVAAKGSGGLGVSNIKRFGFNGPLAMEVGVAASGAAAKPDFLAEMAFTGTDWRLTRVVPGG